MVERAVAGWLAEVAPVDDTARHLDVEGGRVVVDVVVPSWRLIVEVDGAYWHRQRVEQDTAKTARLTTAGWQVVRMRIAPLGALSNDDIVVKHGCPRDWVSALTHKLRELGLPVSPPATRCAHRFEGSCRSEARTWCASCRAAMQRSSER